MNDTCIRASVSHPTELTAMPARDRELRRQPAIPQPLIATWRWRIHFRWGLQQKLSGDPHLIDDIGLTRRRVEAEIAKPFWQA